MFIEGVDPWKIKPRYGFCDSGKEIVAPDGWKILSEGKEIPQVHREYTNSYGRFGLTSVWCSPRRCHSTMTSINAQVWGSVRAIAVPIETDVENLRKLFRGV
jgi:hypothetical protein